MVLVMVVLVVARLVAGPEWPITIRVRKRERPNGEWEGGDERGEKRQSDRFQ